MFSIYGDHFYGNKISDYGIENGFVDYGTFAKAFDAVMSNDIITITSSDGYYWEQISGFNDNSEQIEEIGEKIEEIDDKIIERQIELEEVFGALDDDEQLIQLEEQKAELEEQKAELEYEEENQPEIFQFFIVSTTGADILEEVNEIVYYCEALDMYVWGVTHWGTSWDYVLTDIPCNTGEI